jgi:low molecular weight protein-tyrosine phosphatase
MIKRILFLCTGNYYRSRFAEELFNHHATIERLNWHASSCALALERGAANEGPMSAHALAALRDRGIAPAGSMRVPIACTGADFEHADLVVAMKEAEHRQLVRDKFSGWEQRAIYWHIHDLDAGGTDQAIEAISCLVLDLIRQLKQQQ